MPLEPSLDWFPLWLSLRVAAIATGLVLILGTALAYLLSHKAFRGRNLLDSLVTLPLVLPPTVVGYYLLILLGRNSPLGRRQCEEIEATHRALAGNVAETARRLGLSRTTVYKHLAR